jgi:hypothetical protein
VAARFFLVLNLPILFLVYAPHDDGLYMRLAAILASGHWLGHFDQFTLMKGPGYPAFLAISGLSGLPISATQALFQALALLAAAWAVLRLTGSRAIAMWAIVILTFYPIGFYPAIERIIRDQIYWAQSLLIFSLFTIMLFAPPRRRTYEILIASLTGLILGWAWLTREEGIWFLPGLGLLAAGAILINRKNRIQLVGHARNLCIVLAGFIAVNAAFMTGNLIAYGSFIGVDFKEHNFKATVEALEDVDTGPILPFVPVSNAARSAVAKISPTFAPLAVALAPGGPAFGWNVFGCRIYKQTCGDIAGGWFVWALRDAATMNHFYESPKTAAENFGKIANEIAAACADGRLRCHHRWVSYMPRMTSQQWASLPHSLLSVSEQISFLKAPSPAEVKLSYEENEAFRRYWSFLNYPHIVPTSMTPGEKTVRGWYYDSQSVEWPMFKVFAEGGQEIPSTTTRQPSPDIRQHFSDDRADNNRYQISFYCPNQCTMAAQIAQRPDLRIAIDHAAPTWASSGSATLYVDDVSGGGQPFVLVSSAEKPANHIRAWLISLYNVLIPLLLLVSLYAIVMASWRAYKSRSLDAVLLTALAAWTFIATRIVILALIDASSFPAANFTYGAPANYLAVVAAFLSIAAYLDPGWRRDRVSRLSSPD